MRITELSETQIRSHLSRPYSSSIEDEIARDNPYPQGLLPASPRPAAVLVPFLEIDGAWHILLTRRTESLAEHSGQVAFPGGRMDPDDVSPEATAMREAYEEIGLLPESVHLLGRLEPFVTITNYLVTPVVARITWPVPLTMAVEEVSRVFTIPLAWLADQANHEIQERPLPPPYPPVSVIYFRQYDGELLWGVSARIIFHLLERLVWSPA